MSLAKVTRETRLSLKIGGIILVLGLVFFLIFKGGSFLYGSLFPTPPAPAEKKFGEIPPVSFPKSSNIIPEFDINTVSGNLPSFPLTINVYKLKEFTPTITALQNAKIKAASLGYTENQVAINTSDYKWTKPNSNNNLVYNIISLNFSVDSDFLTNPSLEVGNLTNSEGILNAALAFIDTLGADKVDLDLSKSVIFYYFINNGQLTEVKDPNSASVATIYLPQNSVNNLPIYYPGVNPSTLHLTLNGTDTKNVVSASYIHFTPDLNQFSTYPLKTAEQAYKDLRNGKGYIVKPTTATTVDITEVSLGYYLSDNPDQKYLLPIVIFRGANDFLAYVSAVNN